MFLLNFFGYFWQHCRDEVTRLHYMRFQLMDLLVRVILRIVIKVVEKQNNMNVLETNAVLKVHLEHVETEYPHIFKKVNGLDEHDADILPSPLSTTSSWRAKCKRIIPPKIEYRSISETIMITHEWAPPWQISWNQNLNDKRNEMPGEWRVKLHGLLGLEKWRICLTSSLIMVYSFSYAYN